MLLDRRHLLQLGLLYALSGASRFGRAGEPRRRVYVLPLGPQLPPADVEMARTALLAFYDVDVVGLARVDLPVRAYYPPRKRYRAEKLLPVLEAARPPDGHRIVGLTGVDISTTKGRYPDWGILGLATVGGTACVLSSFRCRRGAKDRRHASERFGKVAVHEVGHTLGLEHCSATRWCLMRDGGGSVKTTDDECDLCPSCRTELGRRGYGVGSAVRIPWLQGD